MKSNVSRLRQQRFQARLKLQSMNIKHKPQPKSKRDLIERDLELDKIIQQKIENSPVAELPTRGEYIYNRYKWSHLFPSEKKD